jgi:hypothetical protein
MVGAAQPEYNGTQKILTVPDVDSFTFAVSGSPATPATIDTANGYAAIKAAGAKVPFIVQDGLVYINVAMIGELSADIITSGELTSINIFGSTITGSKLQTTVGDSQIVMCDGGNINGYNYSSDTLAFIQGGITKYILHTAGIRGTVELLGSIITLPFVAPSGNTTCTAEMNTGSVSANSKGALYGKGSSVFQAFAGTGYDGSNYNYSTGVIAEGAWPLQIVPGATTSPSHPAKIGTLWVSSAGKLYINTNGSTTWAVVGSQS